MSSAKHGPKRVTLAMIKGKPIATSVPVIHYHASDDELEEIYPSTDEDKGPTPDQETVPNIRVSIPPKDVRESNIAECTSETRSISTENIPLEGTPPALAPWKVFSEIKGKITKTFEEKLSEMKNDRRKRRRSRGESSSISDVDDQGCVTPFDDKLEGDGQAIEPGMTFVCQKSNPVRYVGFSGVKTGLKDKRMHDESVESGVEASEFSQDPSGDIAPCAKDNASNVGSIDKDNHKVLNTKRLYTNAGARARQTNLKSLLVRSLKQLILRFTRKYFAAFVAVCCVFYAIPVPEYLLGFAAGIFITVTFYNTVIELKKILTTLPDGDGYATSPTTIPVLEIPAVEEHAVVERFQGWLNELPYTYEPSNYHVARTKSVYLRLEGSILRIMETRTNVPKRAIWDEPNHNMKFIRKRVYDLTAAKIDLIPHGLARRRRWSKKYPICITLKREALICNVAMKSTVNDDPSTNGCSCKDGRAKIACVDHEATTMEWEDGRDDEDDFRAEEGTVDDEAEYYQCSGNYTDYVRTNDGFDNDSTKYEERLEAGCDDSTDATRNQKISKDQGTEERTKSYGFDNIRREQVADRLQDDRAISVVEMCNENRNNNNEKKRKKKRKEKKEKKEKKNWKQDLRWDKRWLSRGKIDKEEIKEGTEDNGGDGDNAETMHSDLDEEEQEEENEEMEDDEEELEEDEEEEEEEEEEKEEKEVEDEEEEEEEEEEAAEEEEEEEEKEGVEEGTEEIRIRREDRGPTDNRCSAGKKTGKKKKKKKKRAYRFAIGKKASQIARHHDDQRSEVKIFVFARADREKEDWYRRLVAAATRRRVGEKRDSLRFAIDERTTNTESRNSFSTWSSADVVTELSYNAYMSRFLETDCCSSTAAESTFSLSNENNLSNCWINCLLTRLLFDVCKCPETINLIQDKIQRKLSNIKLPYFMECLLVSEVAIGQGAPIIRNVGKPVNNERGLWLDFDVTYNGSLTMTVETKLNLMKLTRTGSVPTHSDVIIPPAEKQDSSAQKSAIFDSELEDTPETSTEDDVDASGTRSCNTSKEATSSQSSGKRFLNMVDKIAGNKYFQHAAELSYVRRAMEGVSNTEIRLMVTVSTVEGCLSINIPPPPSDRLWYGFKPVPKVSLTVKPAVGERTVNIVYITKWIEAKLLREFEKLVVLPNMDDLVVPLCPNYPYETMR